MKLKVVYKSCVSSKNDESQALMISIRAAQWLDGRHFDATDREAVGTNLALKKIGKNFNPSKHFSALITILSPKNVGLYIYV